MDEDPYIRGFLRDYFLRPSCHQCHFTSTKRCSDFTIADWWGYKKTSPIDKGYEQKGVSLILCNTPKALRHSKKMQMTWRERTIEEAKKTNGSLSHPFEKSEKRDDFWNDYKNLSFHQMVEKYMQPEKLPISLYIRVKFSDTVVRTVLLKVIGKFEGLMRKLGLYKFTFITYKS